MLRKKISRKQSPHDCFSTVRLGKHAEGRPQGAQQPVVYLAVDLLAEAVTEQMRVRSSEYDPHPGTK